MPLTITWIDVAIRLGLALIAGALVGFNRGEKGKPAGLRTTTLVCLAAALTMVLTNMLIHTTGKTSDSFVQLDMMRLPLGLLTGVGFIGAGTIVRTKSDVQGVTTAATLWFVTIMGLCFGAGKLGTGGAALGLTLFVLWGMGWLEAWLLQARRGTLRVLLAPSPEAAGLTPDHLRRMVETHGTRVISWKLKYADGQLHGVAMRLRWFAKGKDDRPPGFVDDLARNQGIHSVSWTG